MNPYDLNKEAAGNAPQQQQTQPQQPQQVQKPQQTQSQSKKPADQATSAMSSWGSLNGPLLYALVGGGLGAGAGALLTKSDPDEDKEKRVKRRLLNAVLLGGMGAGAGALLNKGLDYFAADPSKKKPDMSTRAAVATTLNDMTGIFNEDGPGLFSTAWNTGLVPVSAGGATSYGFWKFFRNRQKANRANASAEIVNTVNRISTNGQQALKEQVDTEANKVKAIESQLASEQNRLNSKHPENEARFNHEEARLRARSFTDQDKVLLKKYHEAAYQAAKDSYKQTLEAIEKEYGATSEVYKYTQKRLNNEFVKATQEYNNSIAAIDNGTFTDAQIEYLVKEFRKQKEFLNYHNVRNIQGNITDYKDKLGEAKDNLNTVIKDTETLRAALKAFQLNPKDPLTSKQLRMFFDAHPEVLEYAAKHYPNEIRNLAKHLDLGQYNARVLGKNNLNILGVSMPHPRVLGGKFGRGALVFGPAAAGTIWSGIQLQNEIKAYNQKAGKR